MWFVGWDDSKLVHVCTHHLLQTHSVTGTLFAGSFSAGASASGGRSGLCSGSSTFAEVAVSVVSAVGLGKLLPERGLSSLRARSTRASMS